MIITVDKNNKVISLERIDGVDYSYKIVDYAPTDIDIYDYKYSFGDYIKLGKKETVTQEEINFDVMYRLTCLELGITE